MPLRILKAGERTDCPLQVCISLLLSASSAHTAPRCRAEPMDPQAQAQAEADAAALLGADPAALTGLLGDLTSPANEARSRAERLFHSLRASHPDALALRLAHLLLSPSHPSAPMAAVLLRRLLSPGSQAFVYRALTPATQSSLRALLLSASSAPALSKSISKKLSDAVAEPPARLLHLRPAARAQWRLSAWPGRPRADRTSRPRAARPACPLAGHAARR